MNIKVKYLNGLEKEFKNIDIIMQRGSRLVMYEKSSLPDEYIILKPEYVESMEIISGE